MLTLITEETNFKPDRIRKIKITLVMTLYYDKQNF
jgi:hypothetical protein